jgi:hypothetical protein
MDWRKMCCSRAAGCDEKATQARDPEVRAIYVALAEQWRELAEHPQPPALENPSEDTHLG